MGSAFRIVTILALLATSATAQTITRFQPSRQELIARYKRSAMMDSATKNTVFKSSVDAHWLPGGKAFWYCNILADSLEEYIYVDATTASRKPAFDMDALTAALRAAGVNVKSGRPGITALSPEAAGLRFEMNKKWYRYQQGQVTAIPDQPPVAGESNQPGISPDKKWTAFIKDGNVFVASSQGGAPVQFTTDGTPQKPYGRLSWSPDSKYLAGYYIQPVQDSSVYYILTAVPNTTRGQLRSQPYKQPGDPFTTYTMFVFDITQRKTMKTDAEPIDFLDAPRLHWLKDAPAQFTYEKTDRGHQRFRVIGVDAASGKTRAIVDEQTKTFIYESTMINEYPGGTNLLLRSSEKDGWKHLYLVDLTTGKEQQVTKGNWIVRGVDSIDVKKRQIWFQASGMQAGEDPYNVHYYRIGFDGKGLLPLTPEVGTHDMKYAPGGQYYTDTYSQVNVPPVTKLRRAADGKEVLLLEKADVSRYRQSGAKPPEPFVAKARDGVTDIYGIVSRPSDYDPNKKYPVLENIYAGPHSSFVPKTFTPYSEMQSLAELGFIVVMIDGMGTANRSKAFHDVCWQNLADAGLPDRQLWIQALARQYPYVDAERVGIYGTSAGGQNTVSALLFHSGFYKAGVSACGCHDNRVDKQWWNEQWMGYPVGPHYDAQSNVTNAARLQGNLLLIVGEYDTNVPPESTYRVADALIKANKDFDFLAVPGMGHSDGGPYGRMKKRDFFVKHLMGVAPPAHNNGELPIGVEVGRERWTFK
ncbi:S9 family peptidase [Chitinophaga horti]|uniref:S9 family peptidase n=1 Tax=Chitinophaga horti TaxID=2920382 RepID=A0ABY6J4E6_9BACT|nr:S9 family peptidase [Chitinophaga horti]UYQ94549.1 S9 family peptidase [Chitinophaga horti]